MAEVVTVQVKHSHEVVTLQRKEQLPHTLRGAAYVTENQAIQSARILRKHLCEFIHSSIANRVITEVEFEERLALT